MVSKCLNVFEKRFRTYGAMFIFSNAHLLPTFCSAGAKRGRVTLQSIESLLLRSETFAKRFWDLFPLQRSGTLVE